MVEELLPNRCGRATGNPDLGYSRVLEMKSFNWLGQALWGSVSIRRGWS
jgi:hypothetical protein